MQENIIISFFNLINCSKIYFYCKEIISSIHFYFFSQVRKMLLKFIPPKKMNSSRLLSQMIILMLLIRLFICYSSWLHADARGKHKNSKCNRCWYHYAVRRCRGEHVDWTSCWRIDLSVIYLFIICDANCEKIPYVGK